jgi:hypothetical protein
MISITYKTELTLSLKLIHNNSNPDNLDNQDSQVNQDNLDNNKTKNKETPYQICLRAVTKSKQATTYSLEKSGPELTLTSELLLEMSETLSLRQSDTS